LIRLIKVNNKKIIYRIFNRKNYLNLLRESTL
jgi:hypothetical protein